MEDENAKIFCSDYCVDTSFFSCISRSFCPDSNAAERGWGCFIRIWWLNPFNSRDRFRYACIFKIHGVRKKAAQKVRIRLKRWGISSIHCQGAISFNCIAASKSRRQSSKGDSFIFMSTSLLNKENMNWIKVSSECLQAYRTLCDPYQNINKE